jgi:pimeloyl-ACP methyl ester carboxylesterase
MPPTTTRTVTSRDGTTIAYDQTGSGPALVLVTGALGNRFGQGWVEPLARHFTVIDYSRRGRGDSGDTPPYAVEREIEDIAALIDAVGGTASLYGITSGAVLALAAASKLPTQVAKLALYEPPFITDNSRPPLPGDYVPHLNDLIAAGRRSVAVEYFLTEAIRLPQEWLAGMKQSPMWPGLEQVAHTIAYDGTIMGDTMSGKPLPTDRWTAATMPTLVMHGGNSESFFDTGASALAALLPDARHRTIPGQDHNVSPDALAPILIDFFTA